MVKKSSQEIDLKQATKEGFTPCPSCGADKIKPKEEKTDSKKKEEKK